jgi:phosphopantothenate-cysteine ligase/phosphopantothenoylcysteine decarboxylase/phosphopantothenate--cysteine ligase
MKFLVTAGNTQTPIDKVRCITNIFTGRTGTQIALEAHRAGHAVCLLTSHPEVVPHLAPAARLPGDSWRVRKYRAFDDLYRVMADEIPDGDFDAIVHCAAVSDYALGGVYVPAAGTEFDPNDRLWQSRDRQPRLEDASAGKVKSHHEEVWLRLVRTPKLVDLIRERWGFRGTLVKFKLEVGVEEAQLLEIGETSRRASGADLLVANTVEGMNDLAYLIGPGAYRRLSRPELAASVIAAVSELRRS